MTGTLAPAWAAAPGIRKVKTHLFEPLDITLDHPGVLMFKPRERQYDACVEVVADGAAALAALPGLTPDLGTRAAAVHAARVHRCVTTKIDGRITLAGVRGIAVADVIRKLDAKSQRDADVSELFLPPNAPQLV